MSDFIMYNINRKRFIEECQIIRARIKLIPPLKRTKYQISVFEMMAPTKINALENLHLSHEQIQRNRYYITEQVVPTSIIISHNINQNSLN